MRIYCYSLIFETETETFGLWSQNVRLILRLLICGLDHLCPIDRAQLQRELTKIIF